MQACTVTQCKGTKLKGNGSFIVHDKQLPSCPAFEDFESCPAKTYKQCTSTKLCSWCKSNNGELRCVAGDAGSCSEPEIYTHCDTPLPTASPTLMPTTPAPTEMPTVAPTQAEGFYKVQGDIKKWTCSAYRVQYQNGITLAECTDRCDRNMGMKGEICSVIYYRPTSPKTCRLSTKEDGYSGGPDCPVAGGKFTVYERMRDLDTPTAATEPTPSQHSQSARLTKTLTSVVLLEMGRPSAKGLQERVMTVSGAAARIADV